MSGYAATIPARVCGIPCLIGIADYAHRIGAWPEDDWTDCTWEVLDRNGRPAPWLEKKALGTKHEDAICELIDEHFAEDRRIERICREEERAEAIFDNWRECSARQFSRIMDGYERSRGL